MKHLKLYEEFEEGKFSIEDVDIARVNKKKIYSSIIKNNPDHDKDIPLEVFNIDQKTGEIGVITDDGVFYIDLEDIEDIEK